MALGNTGSNLVVMLTTVISLLQGTNAFAKNSFVCNHPDKPGGWGALDMGCDANQYGDVKRMKAIYGTLIFDRNPEGIEETQEYITNIQATIREIAKDYYLKRVPNAKPATLAAWMETAVTIAAHESKLSHYRLAKDNRYKFMTGDQLISHGMMQVNQNYHANKEFDSSFDLVGNVVAALDYYFTKWNGSIEQKCYHASLGKHPTLELMLTNRARSAYSSYNSGSNFCRFTDTTAKWARNDKAFFETLTTKPWKKYVIDDKRAAPINVKCLIDGDDLCATAQKGSRETLIKDRPLVLADGRTCVTADGENFTCANDTRIFTCVAKIDPDVMEAKPVKLDKLPVDAKVTLVKDREPVCQQAVQGLFKVGQQILLKKEILMRDEVGGSPMGNTKAGRIYQVLDYEVRLGDSSERYYEIQTPNKTRGWIYAGKNEDRADWIVVASEQDVADLARADEVAKAERAARKAQAQAQPEPVSDIVVVGRRAVPEETEVGQAEDTEGTLTKGPLAQQPVATPTVKAPSDDYDDADPVAVLPIKGSVVEIVRVGGIVMRETAGEDSSKAFIHQTYRGARFLVEDVATLGTENKIYLKVTSGEHTGWIYAGCTSPMNTVPQWIKITK